MSMKKNIEMYRKHLKKYFSEGYNIDKTEWRDESFNKLMEIYARYNMFFWDIIRSYYDGVNDDCEVLGALEQLGSDIMCEIDLMKEMEEKGIETDCATKEWLEAMEKIIKRAREEKDENYIKSLEKTGADFS